MLADWPFKIAEHAKTKLIAAMFGLAAVTLGFVPGYAGATEVQSSRFITASVNIAPPSGAVGLCRKYNWACGSTGKSARPVQQERQLISDVNRQVNSTTRSISDTQQYQKKEHWSLPTAQGGDCEDFALLKKRELVRKGIAPERLLIATVLDRQKNPHAVLVFRASDGDIVLDSLTDQIRPWKDTRYTFLRMQNPSSPGSWVGVFQGG